VAANPGESGVLTVTFEKPGTYEMYCPNFAVERMEGAGDG
jgi:plastocyanin